MVDNTSGDRDPRLKTTAIQQPGTVQN